MPSEILTHYYKLPYIGPFPIPKELLSNVIYTFICASCNDCYVGETTRHYSSPFFAQELSYL